MQAMNNSQTGAGIELAAANLICREQINPPPDRQSKIWRYLDFAKFVSLLKDGVLVFNRSDKYEDPFEGTLPFVKLQTQEAKILAERLDTRYHGDKYYNRIARTWVYLNCWHLNEHESMAMWKLYGYWDESVCIQSTYQLLDAALPEDVVLGSVKYIDYGHYQMPPGWVQPFFHKWKSFDYENEVRAVAANFPISDGELARQIDSRAELSELEKLNPPVKRITVDLNFLVERIYVSPLAESWFVDLVKDVTEKYGLNKSKVTRSALATDI